MKRAFLLSLAVALPATGFVSTSAVGDPAMSYGQRPAYLVDKLEEGELKDKLSGCLAQTPERTDFSIGHRGAPLMFPEHTVQSNLAAARQGAGILECDVTFTKDKELVCRHAQNDLHTTTDIVTTDLNAKCTQPFTPASGETEATAECRTSDITLEEFRTLKPKMDSSDPTAETAEAFLGGTAPFRTTLYADGAELMTHAESIELFKSLGAKFTPELKAPSVEMPFDGFSQEDYAQKLVDEYEAAGVPPEDVWPQSFNLSDIQYWIDNTAYGEQAVYLDDRYEASDDDEGLIDPNDPASFKPTMQELADMGVNYIAPPIWMLITTNEAGEIVPSAYAEAAKEAGLTIISWSLERSGPLADGGGWYFQSVEDVIDSDADYYNVLHVLAQDVGIVGMFSDWPATVTFYANCYGL
ncbi:glycerophosphodiester phosphodiesterase family protein [Chelativorans sp. M5D2P16]|uniref:glycerophosphodiester phosphodiesterase family protein n=1 Tax=Chelativorans sp. M5D2P16 TaxID=3095678 RepID=UPI002ACAC3F4|nr:glycerophosphodiester phosphodiesterase family protein [Chelativorans sp. M5D2P16]MDZ5696062.1 glycerophosphodiester phosphodiesterase family protein [Chelativorans sp. M5D2P16]